VRKASRPASPRLGGGAVAGPAGGDAALDLLEGLPDASGQALAYPLAAAAEVSRLLAEGPHVLAERLRPRAALVGHTRDVDVPGGAPARAQGDERQGDERQQGSTETHAAALPGRLNLAPGLRGAAGAYSVSPGRTNWISGTRQAGEVLSR